MISMEFGNGVAVGMLVGVGVGVQVGVLVGGGVKVGPNNCPGPQDVRSRLTIIRQIAVICFFASIMQSQVSPVVSYLSGFSA